MLKELRTFLVTGFGDLLDPGKWNTLDVDYFPPRVERLWMQKGDNRYYLHFIHPTDKPCLFHKHRWPSAIHMLKGAYEMGIAYSEKEVTSEEAYLLPNAAKLILNEGSSYEMTESHGLHYVRPIGGPSFSVMVTGKPYPDPRKEVDFPKLKNLSEDRRIELLAQFRAIWPQPTLLKW